MSNSKLITSGLFTFTSAFLVYLILKKNKKTLNLLLKDNLNKKKNKKDNYEQENNIEIKEEKYEENNIEIKEEKYEENNKEIEEENKEDNKEENKEENNEENKEEKYKENNIEIEEENEEETNEENNKEIKEENDNDEIFNFQKVSNLDKKIKFIPDNNQKNENSWFSFLSFK